MGWRNNADTIIANKLYLGNILVASTPQTLIERHITHIISVCTEPIPAHNPASGYITHRIPVGDTPAADLLIHLPAACRFIHNAIQGGGVVLVHCVQGLSRSACVVAAYLMWSRRISATDSLQVVRQARQQIWLNPALHEQLVLFELCQYAPSTSNGVYRSWRIKADQGLHHAGGSRS